MDEAFSNAFSPPHRHKVLGFNLRPLTVGHLLVLESSGVHIAEPRTIDELSFLVFVCSQKYADAFKGLQSWWAPFVFRLWGRLWQNRDITTQARAWEAYMSESLLAPNVKTQTNSPRLECPLGVRLLVMLMRELGMSADEAKATPVSTANCLWVTVGEMEGSVQLWTERDQNFWQQCEQLDREAYGTA